MITTTDRSVYLMGLVSQREGDIATEAVRTVAGVDRVVKLFEHLD
jgi:osmotically-inducible protein OsmY